VSDRVLILGGTGMLGHEAISRFTPHFEVHASVRDPELAAQYELPATLHAFDAYEPQALAELLDVVDPAVVLNCIGIVKQLEDASRPLPAITLNSLCPHQLAAVCEHKGCRLIHVSTDCVFSGRLPLGQSYREEDEADARDLYGLTKLLGEVKEPFLTVRTSIIGWELERASGLLAWFAGQEGKEVSGYRKAIFSGLTTRALSDVLVEVAQSYPALAGVYHIAAEPIDKFELLTMMRDRLDLDCSIRPVDEPTVNRALDPSRFRAATGIEAPAWDEMLDDYLTARERDEATA
jgi:dTDP-4-dehydrorhamnose reductase